MQHRIPATLASLSALLVLTSCGERAITKARAEGTESAWEAVLDENPSVNQETEALNSLGTLKLEAAQESGESSDFQAILDDKRFSGQEQIISQANAAVELLDFKSASQTDTLEGWKSYLSTHRNTNKTRTIRAEQAVLHHEHIDWFEFTEPEMKRVSIQDPQGDSYWPNGWQFTTQFTNVSDKLITDLKFNVVFLNEDGEILDTMGFDRKGAPYYRHWAVLDLDGVEPGLRKRLDFHSDNPLVSWNPRKEPLSSGKTWIWTDYTRTVPPGWSGDFAIRIRSIDYPGKK